MVSPGADLVCQDNHTADPPILRLPRELLDLISRYLEVEAVIAFRLSCRKFYPGNPPVSHLLKELRFSPEPTLRFAWVCLGESYISGPGRVLVCSACRCYHSKELFSIEESDKGPHSRICAGRKGRLRISPNNTISFEELAQKPSYPYGYFTFTTNNEDTKQDPSGHLYPMHGQVMALPSHEGHARAWDNNDKPRSLPYLAGRGALRKPLMWRDESGPRYVLQYYWRFCFDDSQTVLLQCRKLKHELDKSVISFCPHVKFEGWKAVYAIQKMRLLRSRHCFPSRLKCSYCGMHATVLLRDTGHTVTVEVERILGAMRFPTDPWWLSSIENPGILVPRPGKLARFKYSFRKRMYDFNRAWKEAKPPKERIYSFG